MLWWRRSSFAMIIGAMSQANPRRLMQQQGEPQRKRLSSRLLFYEYGCRTLEHTDTSRLCPSWGCGINPASPRTAILVCRIPQTPGTIL
ncbi:hypothetical protein F5X68DRAFT_204477 [Plectosphaerella plurivora]|uniref:Uncharacterized protein n=1 Tax=Plectosphaerella plurivora TaxID=936078 RepID=A0A9P8VEM4_9PEZI|nr:hypothetical protein F5X68DRAFT_204477 [Plectosphaerella plurivora]